MFFFVVVGWFFVLCGVVFFVWFIVWFQFWDFFLLLVGWVWVGFLFGFCWFVLHSFSVCCGIFVCVCGGFVFLLVG